MKYALLAATALSFAASHALAQDDQAPPYEKGPVWIFTGIKTHDGHFDDYMKFLDTDLKKENEALMHEGRLLGYKIFVNGTPGANEPDIWIAREYPNMAAFDHSTADDFALQQRIVGSVAKANQAQAARGSIRDIVTQVMTREVTLK